MSTPLPSPEATPIAPESAGALSAANWDETFARIAKPVAIASLFTMILGRCLAPATRGVLSQTWVGRAELLGALATQTMLVAQVATLLTATFALLRIQRLSGVLRFFLAGSCGILLAMAAAAETNRLIAPMAIILAIVTGLTAIACGSASLFAPHARAAGGMVAMSGVAVLLGHAGWWVNTLGADRAKGSLRAVGAIVSTLGWGTHAALIAVALLWVGARRARWTSALTAIALALATLASWNITRPITSTSSSLQLVMSRASLAVLSPSSALVLVPTSAQVFVALLGMLVILSLLRSREQSTPIVGGMSLVLLAGSSGDIPLCAFSLCTAGLLVLLGAHDSRRFWRLS
ncbi:MAG: hypothetical protein U0165_09010 [Polyangiaceae bacterium]